MKKGIKITTLVVSVIIVLLLIATTILERYKSAEFVHSVIYGSWYFIAMWIILALLLCIRLFQQKRQKQIVLFSIHISLIIILISGLFTFFTSEKGLLHLRQGVACNTFTDEKGKEIRLPFAITLNNFDIETHRGTQTHSDYISTITLANLDKSHIKSARISMNNILRYKNFRFYQYEFDEDQKGSTLLVAHDPWGIALFYLGSMLLLLSMLLFMIFDKRFHDLFRKISVPKSIILGTLLLFCSVSTFAKESPKVLPQEVAAEFGDLYVYHNGRICPLQTLAKDFTIKLYGKASYKGFSAEQVFTGWMFFYEYWKDEPMIKIKKDDAARYLGIENRLISLQEFQNSIYQYKLEIAKAKIKQGQYEGNSRNIREVYQKYDLIKELFSGELLKIYPSTATKDSTDIEWYSQNDILPLSIASDERFFIQKSWNYVSELVAAQDFSELSTLLIQIKKYQTKNATEYLPKEFKFKAEKAYNEFPSLSLLARIALIFGILYLAYFCFKTTKKQNMKRHITLSFDIVAGIMFVELSSILSLRWIIGEHIPLIGSEAMIFMGWTALLLSFITSKKYRVGIPLALIICSLTLFVATMKNSNPQISLLMPVLDSPLMSSHIILIMLSYTLFAFMMLNGLTAIILYIIKRDNKLPIEHLHIISRIMSYPAIFCIATGCFIGAVWANVTWGTYWSWDPKETWTLITFLIYAFGIHLDFFKGEKGSLRYHIFCVVAFLSVLVTYFGVNFFLGGVHSFVG